MSTEDNKAKERRVFEEGLDQGKVAVLDELFAPDFSYRDPDLPGVRTFEDFKRYTIETRSAFPDLHMTIEDMIAEGEQVVVRWKWRGTNTGDLVLPAMHIPATGKQVTVTGITIARYAGGKKVEAWTQSDNLGMFQQLGLIPVPQPVG